MLKQTALINEHKKLNAKLVDFGGWELPVQYSGLAAEHLAVRTAVGIFDVSHMGEIFVEGAQSLSFLNFLVTNELSSVAIEQAIYTALCNENGGIVDDLVIYNLSPKNTDQQKYLLVVNASNVDKDFDHIQKIYQLFLKENPSANLNIQNKSSSYSQIAIQGPKAAEVLQKITDTDLSTIKTYWCKVGKVLKSESIIARTGYTGEDGFEIYLPWADAPEVWRSLLEVGAPFGLIPCGLGARDTLRLEMKYSLYGHELSEETTPLETGLLWITKLAKPNFIGKSALVKQKEAGIKRATIGVKSLGRAIPRQGYEVFDSTQKIKVGVITSGTLSPSHKIPIGIALVDKPFDGVGTHLWVKVREDFHEFEVVKTPFFKHN